MDHENEHEPMTDEQVEQASSAMVELLEAYEGMGLIVLTPDKTGIDHITDFGLDTARWMASLIAFTLNPKAHDRPIRRARDRAEKFSEALEELLDFMRHQQVQAN